MNLLATADGSATALRVIRTLPWERVHHYDSRTGDVVASTGARFEVRCAGVHARFSVPLNGLRRILDGPRLLRRLARTDRYTAAIDPSALGVVVAGRGVVYRYDLSAKRLTRVLVLPSAHALLHGSIAVGGPRMVFGAYGPNPGRGEVPVWSSVDGGRTWSVAHTFAPGEVRHVHRVSWDPLNTSFWVATGDADGECYLYRFDAQMKNPRRFGDGSQAWRAVGLLFDSDSVRWGMDAPGQQCRLMTMERQTGRVTGGALLGGPVWYTKGLADGVSLLQTTVEPAVLDGQRMCTLWANRGGAGPGVAHRWAKDALPAGWGRYGQVLFASGHQTSQDFVLSGIALRGFDGASVRLRLETQGEALRAR